MSRITVTVNLPEELVKKTALFCKKHSVKLSEIIRDAIRDYLHKQEMAQARTQFTAHLQKRGILSERSLLRTLGF